MPRRSLKYNYSDFMKELDEEIDEAISELEERSEKRNKKNKNKIMKDMRSFIDEKTKKVIDN